MLAFESYFMDVSSAAPTITGHELLTGAQLSSEPVNQEDALISGNLSAPGEVSLGQQFFTIAGTPGTTSIPAGTFTFKALGYVNGSSDGVAKWPTFTRCAVFDRYKWKRGEYHPTSHRLDSEPGRSCDDNCSRFDWCRVFCGN
jgi:hypothetical protein